MRTNLRELTASYPCHCCLRAFGYLALPFVIDLLLTNGRCKHVQWYDDYGVAGCCRRNWRREIYTASVRGHGIGKHQARSTWKAPSNPRLLSCFVPSDGDETQREARHPEPESPFHGSPAGQTRHAQPTPTPPPFRSPGWPIFFTAGSRKAAALQATEVGKPAQKIAK